MTPRAQTVDFKTVRNPKVESISLMLGKPRQQSSCIDFVKYSAVSCC